MRLLIILSRFPYPLEKGDKLRAYHQIRHLAKNNEIHLFALNEKPVTAEQRQALQPYCKTIHVYQLRKISILFHIVGAFLKGFPLQVGYFYNIHARRKVKHLLQQLQPDHVYCQLLRTAEYVRYCDIPKTLDYQDVFSKGVERRIENAPFYKKPVFRLEYKRLLKYERQVFEDFNHKTIISIPDRDLIPHPDKEKIEVVINGVDTDFFKPQNAEKDFDLVFTGNMGYPPNVDASGFLVSEILPLVREKYPDVKLLLAGASPHASVKALEGKNVKVSGWVEDIRSCYASAKIFIAPMRIGTGLQNKLLEAMSMQIPSITSKLANSALKAKANEEILEGETADDFAQAIIRLLDDATYAKKIAVSGHDFVHSNFNWASATQKLENLFIAK